jgi:hypothetical protein
MAASFAQRAEQANRFVEDRRHGACPRFTISRQSPPDSPGVVVVRSLRPTAIRLADDAVLATIEHTLLRPAVIERALAAAEAAILLDRTAEQRAALETDIAATDAAVRRLTAAIIAGGELKPLVDALKTYDERRRDLEARLASVRAPQPTYDPAAVRRQLKGYLVDWRGLLRERPTGSANLATLHRTAGRSRSFPD